MKRLICENIIDVTSEGIVVESAKKRIHICFDECEKNFTLETGIKFTKCVATRDITTLSFTFFTQPKTNVVFKKNFLKDVFSEKSATNKFLDLQKAILKVGYTTFDLS